MKKQILIFIAACITLATFTACTTSIETEDTIVGYTDTSSSELIEASDEFMNALGNNKLEEAYNMTSIEFKEVATMEIFESFLGEFPILTSYSSYTLDYDEVSTTEDISSEETSVITLGITSGTIIDSEGTENPLTINLVNRDDTWQIVNFSLEPEDVPEEALYLNY